MTSPRVAVIGAAGFVGSHVCAAGEDDERIGEVVRLGRSDLDLSVARPQEARAVLEETGCDVVVNCTGRLDGTPEELALANVAPTVTLVEALAGSEIRLLRIGSAGEYGPSGSDRPIREDDPTWPVNLYGATHLAATHILRAVAGQGLLDGTTLRVFNPVGPGMHGRSLAPEVALRMARAVEEGATAITTGPLNVWRDFVDVRDVGRAVAAAAATSSLPPVINIGSGRATRVSEVVSTLAELAGFTGSVLQANPPSGRSSGVSWISADISLARRHLRWAPAIDLVTSLGDLWDSVPHLASTSGARTQAARRILTKETS